MQKVLVFGTFDLFHEGHRDFLRQARASGDTLSVVVARDVNTTRLKGRAPVNDERTRLANVKNDPSVSDARLGYEQRDDVYRVLDDIGPDIICLGYDQNGFAQRLPEEMAKRGMSVPVVRLQSYKPNTYKSSIMRERVIRNA